MAYGKNVNELLKKGDRSIEQVVEASNKPTKADKAEKKPKKKTKAKSK